MSKITPFLRLDRDPYVSVVDGRLKWIVDAYTTSNRYPYSAQVQLNNLAAPASPPSEEQAEGQSETPVPTVRQRINYIRDSVKVVVDAYDGTMQFFVIDETDPVPGHLPQDLPRSVPGQ